MRESGVYWVRVHGEPWQSAEIADGVCWFPGTEDPWFLDQADAKGYVIGPCVMPPNEEPT